MTLTYEVLPVGPLATNCYLIWEEPTKEALIVDPGADGTTIAGRVEELGLRVRFVALTHGHVDHAGAAGGLAVRFGVSVMAHPAESELLSSLQEQAALFDLPQPDALGDPVEMKDGDLIHLGGERLLVRHAPGHSPGSVCFIDEIGRRAWVGDLIFRESVGRTDLPGGSPEELMRSIKEVVLRLPDDWTLLPGHGPETTVGHERRWNPFLSSGVLR